MTNSVASTAVEGPLTRILIHCLKCAISSQSPDEELSGLPVAATRWNELLAHGGRHRIVPVLSSVLTKDHARRMPDEFLLRLKELDRSNAKLGESLETALCETLDRLLAGGVRSLPWGGSAFRRSIAPDGPQRQNWGVAILVDPKSSGAAIQILEESGFRPWRTRSGPSSEASRRIEGYEAFVEPVNGHVVRVQWNPHGNEFGIRHPFDLIWSRSREVGAAGRMVRLPSPRDLFAAACVKGCSQRWSRLSLVLAAAVHARQVAPSDWPTVFSEGRRMGIARMLMVALLLAESVTASEIAEGLAAEEHRRDATACELARLAWNGFGETSKSRTRASAGAARYGFMARDLFSAKVAFLAGMLFSPSSEDYRICPLPMALYPLYAFIRPARLLSRRLFGRRPARSAESLGPYLGSAPEAIQRMLAMARVGPEDLVYDLGCGDGRIVIAAALKWGARGVGVEIVKELVDKARDAAKTAGVEDRVRFEIGDAMAVDLGEATVVALYLPPAAILELRNKLETELRPGARIVAHEVVIPGWTPAQVELVGTERGITQLHLWTVGQTGESSR